MAMAPGFNAVDRLILLLLRAKGATPIPGPLFLQKETYALRALDPELKQDLGFEPHLLGPFSDALEAETEQLELSGLVVSDRGYLRLTNDGVRSAREVAEKSPAGLVQAVEETKALLNDLSKDELLALVYFGTEGEGFEKESIEYRRVQRERHRLAQALLKKEKVSISKAAEIAGVGVDELITGIGSGSG